MADYEDSAQPALDVLFWMAEDARRGSCAPGTLLAAIARAEAELNAERTELMRLLAVRGEANLLWFCDHAVALERVFRGAALALQQLRLFAERLDGATYEAALQHLQQASLTYPLARHIYQTELAHDGAEQPLTSFLRGIHSRLNVDLGEEEGLALYASTLECMATMASQTIELIAPEAEATPETTAMLTAYQNYFALIGEMQSTLEKGWKGIDDLQIKLSILGDKCRRAMENYLRSILTLAPTELSDANLVYNVVTAHQQGLIPIEIVSVAIRVLQQRIGSYDEWPRGAVRRIQEALQKLQLSIELEQPPEGALESFAEAVARRTEEDEPEDEPAPLISFSPTWPTPVADPIPDDLPPPPHGARGADNLARLQAAIEQVQTGELRPDQFRKLLNWLEGLCRKVEYVAEAVMTSDDPEVRKGHSDAERARKDLYDFMDGLREIGRYLDDNNKEHLEAGHEQVRNAAQRLQNWQPASA